VCELKEENAKLKELMSNVPENIVVSDLVKLQNKVKEIRDA